MSLKITQVRGAVNSRPKQKQNLEALGLRGIRQSVVHQDNASVRGMINVVRHMVTVEEVEGE